MYSFFDLAFFQNCFKKLDDIDYFWTSLMISIIFGQAWWYRLFSDKLDDIDYIWTSLMISTIFGQAWWYRLFSDSLMISIIFGQAWWYWLYLDKLNDINWKLRDISIIIGQACGYWTSLKISDKLEDIDNYWTSSMILVWSLKIYRWLLDKLNHIFALCYTISNIKFKIQWLFHDFVRGQVKCD